MLKPASHRTHYAALSHALRLARGMVPGGSDDQVCGAASAAITSRQASPDLCRRLQGLVLLGEALAHGVLPGVEAAQGACAAAEHILLAENPAESAWGWQLLGNIVGHRLAISHEPGAVQGAHGVWILQLTAVCVCRKQQADPRSRAAGHWQTGAPASGSAGCPHAGSSGRMCLECVLSQLHGLPGISASVQGFVAQVRCWCQRCELRGRRSERCGCAGVPHRAEHCGLQHSRQPCRSGSWPPFPGADGAALPPSGECRYDRIQPGSVICRCSRITLSGCAGAWNGVWSA